MKMIKIVIAVVTALLTSTTSYAVTLGEVRVNSYLSQPLDAEVDIVGLAPGQHEDLRPRVANDEYFERMGIVYDPLLRDLQFDVVRSGTQWLVRVRSRRMVNEPFLTFPLLLNWPGGHMIQVYTLLFDPPPRVQPARVSGARRVTSAQTPAAPATADKVGVDTYGPVRRGETLWPIAKQLKPRGITTQQMMMALLHANPEAFVDGNINNLRAGSTLNIPLRAFIEQLDAEAASVAFAEQNRRWEPPSIDTSPRALERITDVSQDEKLQPPAPPRESDQAVETTQTMDEAVGTTAKPPIPQGQLRIAKRQAVDASDKPDETSQELEAKLLIMPEQIESNLLTAGAMESHLARLEAELERMQQLIELKNIQIEALQAEVPADRADQRSVPMDNIAVADVARSAQATASAGEPVHDAPTAPESEQGSISVTAQVPQSTAADTGQAPWYRNYLWTLWILPGGLIAAILVLVWHRRVQAPALQEVRLTDRPEIEVVKPRPYSVAAIAEPNALKKAEEDFRGLACERLGEDAVRDLSLDDLRKSDITESEVAAGTMSLALANGPSEALLDGGKLLQQPTGPNLPAQDISVEYITSWVEGLHRDDDEPLRLDDEIPGTLNELDDRLSASGAAPQATTDLPEPIDLPEPEQLGFDEELPELLGELDDQLDDQLDAAEAPRTELDPFDLADQVLGGADDDIPTLTELEDQLAGGGEHLQPPGASAGSTPATGPHEDDAFAMSLDLARAYIEIGDQEGAKDMLEHALSGARAPDHRRQIEELLQQIG